MHVVHILPELSQGGVEATVLMLNRELVRRGHECTVISAGGRLVPQVEEAGGQHITLDVCSKNPLTLPLRFRALRSLLSDLRPSVIHAHSRVPAWLVRFANKSLGIPWITTVHGFNSVSRYSEIMTKGDRVICVSHPVSEYIRQHYDIDDGRIDVIHPGIDPDQFDPDSIDTEWISRFKAQHGLEGKTVVTAIGRITQLKDYETFIRAIALGAESNPEITGLIVGGVRHDKQAYYDRLQALLRELNIEPHIRFTDTQSHIAEIYSLSDVVVSCSKKPESFGLTLIEALAMNTPVAATRHGGPLDIVREGENGFLFEPGHPEALADILCNSIPLPPADLRADTLQRFGIDRMIDATLETYRKVL